MFKAKGACLGIIAGNAGDRSEFSEMFGTPGSRSGYQPRKRTFSPCEWDGRSESRIRRVGTGPLLMVLRSCRVRA